MPLTLIGMWVPCILHGTKMFEWKTIETTGFHFHDSHGALVASSLAASLLSKIPSLISYQNAETASSLGY